jgi:hypothetical protein
MRIIVVTGLTVYTESPLPSEPVVNVNITATTSNTFISLDGGTGEDAIAVNHVNGNNVLNGSTGSSFRGTGPLVRVSALRSFRPLRLHPSQAPSLRRA